MLEGNAEQLSSYMTKLRQAVLDALHEEAVLIVAVPVYHAELNRQFAFHSCDTPDHATTRQSYAS